MICVAATKTMPRPESFASWEARMAVHARQPEMRTVHHVGEELLELRASCRTAFPGQAEAMAAVPGDVHPRKERR
jgi:hypothetical protein